MQGLRRIKFKDVVELVIPLPKTRLPKMANGSNAVRNLNTAPLKFSPPVVVHKTEPYINLAHSLSD